jgi:hypothetical protein
MDMESASEFAAYYLERLLQGQTEDAFCGLIECGAVVLPALIDAFSRQENRAIRADIVRCVWQLRRPETVGFLARLLRDPEKAVWQEALDGLVSIGGGQAVRALRETRLGLPARQPGEAITAVWIDEALEQLREQGAE